MLCVLTLNQDQRLISREPFPLSSGSSALKQRSTERFLCGQSLDLLPAFPFPMGRTARLRIP